MSGPVATRCQFGNVPPHPPIRRLWFKTQGGLEYSAVVCRTHDDAYQSRMREQGETLISVEPLPQPAPETVPDPAPVGLDAIDPPPAPFRPDWAVHPGEILGELLEEQHISRSMAATMLRWNNTTVDRVIDGQDAITLEMAGALAQTFGLTANAWIRLQERYTQWQDRRRVEAFVAQRAQPAVSGGA